MTSQIAFTTLEGREIRRIFAKNITLLHLLPEVQFIGTNIGDIQALSFLQERLAIHQLINLKIVSK